MIARDSRARPKASLGVRSGVIRLPEMLFCRLASDMERDYVLLQFRGADLKSEKCFLWFNALSFARAMAARSKLDS